MAFSTFCIVLIDIEEDFLAQIQNRKAEKVIFTLTQINFFIGAKRDTIKTGINIINWKFNKQITIEYFEDCWWYSSCSTRSLVLDQNFGSSYFGVSLRSWRTSLCSDSYLWDVLNLTSKTLIFVIFSNGILDAI